MCTSRLIMDDYLSKTVQQQRNRYNSNKIIEYLDSENLFEVNFVTFHWYWHCCTLIRKCWHAAQLGQKILVWSQVFRLCDQEELPCCDTCVKVPYQSHIRYSECGSTFAVPLLLGTDVLKYELCVYPPALLEAAGTMLQSDKPSQPNAIQGWIQPSST